MEEAIDRLRKIYLKNDVLLREIKKEGFKLTKKKLNEYLNKKEDVLINKKPIKMKPNDFRSILATDVFSNIQVDFMYLPNPALNKKYCLNVIDVYSRKAFISASNTRAKPDEQLINLLEKNNIIPANINCDQEFNTKKMNEYSLKNNITMWFSEEGQYNKNAIVERFNRTFREILLKYETTNNKRYISVIQKILDDNYNNVEQSTIKATPNEVFNKEKTPYQKFTEPKISNIEIGDIVKIINEKNSFTKSSSTTNFSKENYLVISGNYSYKLKKIKDNYIPKKLFRFYELIKIPQNEINQTEKKKTERFQKTVEKQNKKEKEQRNLQKEGLTIKNIIPRKSKRLEFIKK